MTLHEKVTRLAALRAEAARSQAALRELKETFEATPTVAALRQRLAAAQGAMDEILTGLRADALEAFQTSGSKRPHPAVGIREERVLTYDPAQALPWALDNLPGALALETKTFTTIMRGLDPAKRPHFVQEALEPKVTVAQDLSEYLEGPDDPA